MQPIDITIDGVLCNLTYGRVVKTKPNSCIMDDDVGHIVGFSRNDFDELVVLVLWSRQTEPKPFHPSCIEIIM